MSHSTIGDYLKCPRAYYLKNVYKVPGTNRKISIASPWLTLGQTVHEVVESLSQLPVSDRLSVDLLQQFSVAWTKLSGKKGGFSGPDEEEKFQARGIKMLKRIIAHPGPIARPAIKIRQELPYFWLMEEENVILCGKIDWLEYLPDKDGVNIIDFKTGKYDEDPESLQLRIYHLLALRCQSKPVISVGYWYLDRDDEPTPAALSDPDKTTAAIIPIAKKISLARKLNHFICPNLHGCRECLPLEEVVKGQAELVDSRENKNVYYLR